MSRALALSTFAVPSENPSSCACSTGSSSARRATMPASPAVCMRAHLRMHVRMRFQLWLHQRHLHLRVACESAHVFSRSRSRSCSYLRICAHAPMPTTAAGGRRRALARSPTAGTRACKHGRCRTRDQSRFLLPTARLHEIWAGCGLNMGVEHGPNREMWGDWRV